jgi:hypothetical protein
LHFRPFTVPDSRDPKAICYPKSGRFSGAEHASAWLPPPAILVFPMHGKIASQVLNRHSPTIVDYGQGPALLIHLNPDYRLDARIDVLQPIRRIFPSHCVLVPE